MKRVIIGGVLLSLAVPFLTIRFAHFGAQTVASVLEDVLKLGEGLAERMTR
jgi:hypothetical protein